MSKKSGKKDNKIINQLDDEEKRKKLNDIFNEIKKIKNNDSKINNNQKGKEELTRLGLEFYEKVGLYLFQLSLYITENLKKRKNELGFSFSYKDYIVLFLIMTYRRKVLRKADLNSYDPIFRVKSVAKRLLFMQERGIINIEHIENKKYSDDDLIYYLTPYGFRVCKIIIEEIEKFFENKIIKDDHFWVIIDKMKQYYFNYSNVNSED